MSSKRVLILDDEALVMVADRDITRQVDEHRGELSRAEFVNFLIQKQLRESAPDHVTREEFYHTVEEIKTVMRNLLDFFISWNLQQEEQRQNRDFNQWLQKIESLQVSGGTAPEDSPPEN
jgi:hypothetical protein